MSILFVLSTFLAEPEFPGQSYQYFFLKFDEFLAKNIHSQLANFHGTRMFRFQSFLLRMLIAYNEEDLQVPEQEITTDMDTNYFKFMNQLMVEIYDLFFQERLPRVFPDMRQMLQLSNSKKIGDWFLTEFGTTIRFYSFVHPRYILPAFLTARIFSLELI